MQQGCVLIGGVKGISTQDRDMSTRRCWRKGMLNERPFVSCSSSEDEQEEQQQQQQNHAQKHEQKHAGNVCQENPQEHEQEDEDEEEEEEDFDLWNWDLPTPWGGDDDEKEETDADQEEQEQWDEQEHKVWKRTWYIDAETNLWECKIDSDTEGEVHRSSEEAEEGEKSEEDPAEVQFWAPAMALLKEQTWQLQLAEAKADARVELKIEDGKDEEEEEEWDGPPAKKMKMA